MIQKAQAVNATLHVGQRNVLEAEDFGSVVIGNDDAIHAANLGLEPILHEGISSKHMRLKQRSCREVCTNQNKSRIIS